MLAMMRDHWWWPWWVSSLIDLGVVALALIVFFRTSRRGLQAVAGLAALAAVVAAVMAPIVMTEKSDDTNNEMPMMP